MPQIRDENGGEAPVAVVGVGAMGRRIAGRLHDVGRSLVVWNRTPDVAEPLVRRGACVAATPAEAAARAATVIVMVSDPAALSSVSEGRDGLLAGARPGLQIIVMSTVGPAAVTRLAKLRPVGVDVLDAPVLGSLAEAGQGRLRFFVGGSCAAIARAEPLLRQLGTPMRVGDVGAGSAAKLVANHALLGVLTVLGESVALADGLELPRRNTLEVLAVTPLAEQVTHRRAVLDGHPFPTRYRLSLARKDTDLMLESTETSRPVQRLLPVIRSWLLEAEGRGRGEQDYLALLAMILDHAGGRDAS